MTTLTITPTDDKKYNGVRWQSQMEPKAPIRLFESHEEMLHVGLWWRFERSIMEIKPYANEGAPSIVLVVVPRWIANLVWQVANARIHAGWQSE
jgi:hypothetical protein